MSSSAGSLGRVTRCVCHRRTFAELLPLARTAGWRSVEDVGGATACGTGCGSCRPYLAAMLATGATCFRVREPGMAPLPCQDQG